MKSKENTKTKKKISIITAFLWIFLLAIFVVIVNINTKNTNALEEDEQVEIYEEIDELSNENRASVVPEKPNYKTIVDVYTLQFKCQSCYKGRDTIT